MPELFVELFSEEIPARMQARAAGDLQRLLGEALAALSPSDVRTFYGPRRIALAANVAGSIGASATVERGPRLSAPEQALAGFLRKHGATREDLRPDGDYWMLERRTEAQSAAAVVAAAMPGLLRRFPWPKSMRWGGTSSFTWVRPLRRIVCLLDGEVVPFDLREGDDDGHGLASGNLTEGHRFHAPGAFPVTGCVDWQEKLRRRFVLVDAEERMRVIERDVPELFGKEGVVWTQDPGLVEEIAGLVEYPVVRLGRIDDAYMDLPAEVMQVSMRVNQRYFASRLRAGDDTAASWFAFVANIEPSDGGAATVAGNERVLRARFADARYFWDLDRKTSLASRVAALDGVTFHARLGTQRERVTRVRVLARRIAEAVLRSGPSGETHELVDRAALLCKADLTTGMVGEFPELQGVMGRYYALHDGEHEAVADAVRDHYAPRGATEDVPIAPVSFIVGLADRLDQLAGFFAIGERPTGSGDPYALRRAALGIIRIIRGNWLRVSLSSLIAEAGIGFQSRYHVPVIELRDFIIERWRVQMRADGARHDVLTAIFQAAPDDDIVRLLARTDAVGDFLATPEGRDLLAGHRRAANILRIEEKKDGPFNQPASAALLLEPAERALHAVTEEVGPIVDAAVAREDFRAAMAALARLRAPLDDFFAQVTVNVGDNAALRRNRLYFLNQVRATMDRVADFSKIDG
jgi:glycyl-tRNA synthetase beta chain